MARYAVATLCARFFGTAFPIGTFVINIGGSFFLGWFLMMIRERVHVSDTTVLAIAVGFTGAFTAFSTYMHESNALLENGSGLKAIFNLLGSLLVGLLAVRFGMFVAQRW
jgi:CrcB protein